MDKDPTLESNPVHGDPDSKHRRCVRTKIHFSKCTRSNDSFYIVSYKIKRVTTSWTHTIYEVIVDKMIRNPGFSLLKFSGINHFSRGDMTGTPAFPIRDRPDIRHFGLSYDG